jgi:hypothetical protein
VDCQRCGQPTPPEGSPDWIDWQLSHEGGWLCDYCLTDEVKDKADLALLLAYEPEMDGHWGAQRGEWR